ncbi:type 4b pilus protein PilO2 [Polaromonas sp. JS666]|uniref:type 4b pilus protein PilO2 n=1 Tax=Polaromonas sp. (strain JS666 / ATCC BAA-500) TaxID=296591 RepID=UPI0000531DF5|nr:type 4b pilus protein PilO2 [Polaromonas sp. JS666]ABE47304.1 hypothetical protein Bpro_5450 [Polaromonas sp. JS666]
MRIIEFTLGKRKLELVAGLVWHPLHNAGGARSKEIRHFADESEFDFKVLRGSESPHVGFARRSDGAKSGQISAAALIADIVGANDAHRNFLVAIPIPDDKDQYLRVVSHAGVILADGDAVGTRDEIRVRLSEDFAYGNWDAIVCPGDWNIPNSEERGFDDFFNEANLKKPRRWALSDVSLRIKKFLVPTLLLLALLFGGLYGFRLWNLKKIAAAEALRLQNEEVMRGQRPTAAAPVKPWPTMPLPGPFAAACQVASAKAGYTLGNWSFASKVCSSDGLEATWTRSSQYAWISHLKLIRPEAQLSSDGNTASVSVPFTVAGPNDFTEQLPNQQDAVLRMIDLSSRYGVAVKIDTPVEPEPPKTLPGQQGAVPSTQPPPWTALPIEFKTGIGPVEMASLINSPGLRIQKITYSVVSGAFQYSLSGVQYVQR